MINVGIAEFKIARAPEVLTTVSLGSCVGVVIYDRLLKTGGLAHIMLPSVNPGVRVPFNRGKYADTAISDLLDLLVKAGARKEKMESKIFGGACMFSGAVNLSSMNIGEKNVLSVREVLKRQNIPLAAEDTGSNYGRTVEFYLETGEVLVKSYAHETKRY